MDTVTANGLAALLGDGFDVKVTECTDSTNTQLLEAAKHGAPSGSVLAALRQQGGRGRMGRSFCSLPGGLYMSVLLRPQCDIATTCLMTPLAALSVAEAVEAVLGISLDIKWVNDLFYRGKKVCGILAESGGVREDGTVGHVVIGVGLNVYEPCNGFPEELTGIATALLPADAAGKDVMNRLAAETVKRIFAYAKAPQSEKLYEAYRKRLFVLGRRVTVHRGGKAFAARVLELNRDYTLTVEADDGTQIGLLSGEVSLKIDKKSEKSY